MIHFFHGIIFALVKLLINIGHKLIKRRNISPTLLYMLVLELFKFPKQMDFNFY